MYEPDASLQPLQGFGRNPLDLLHGNQETIEGIAVFQAPVAQSAPGHSEPLISIRSLGLSLTAIPLIRCSFDSMILYFIPHQGNWMPALLESIALPMVQS